MSLRFALLSPLVAVALMGQACPRAWWRSQSAPQPKTELEVAASFLVEADDIKPKKHLIGKSQCPDPFDGPITFSGDSGMMWRFDPESIPGWITLSMKEGTLGDKPMDVAVAFNCNITNFKAHSEQARLRVQTRQGERWGDYSEIPLQVDVWPK